MVNIKGKTIVRGADGHLYRLRQTGLEKLTDEEEKEVQEALPKEEQKLEGILKQDMANVAAGCNQHVRIIIPDVDI